MPADSIAQPEPVDARGGGRSQGGELLSAMLQSRKHNASSEAGLVVATDPADWGIELVETLNNAARAAEVTWSLAWPEGDLSFSPPEGVRGSCAVVIDGHREEATVDGEIVNLTSALDIVQSGGARHLVIHCHAEGGHADLGKAVLCGLVGDQELDTDGSAADAGCRRGEYCKRQRGAKTIVYFDTLLADNLVLLGCNTLSAPGAFFSVSPHLTTAALSEPYQSVTAVAGNLVIDPPTVKWVAEMLTSGADPADLSRELNATHGRDGQYAIATFSRLGERSERYDFSSRALEIPAGLDTAMVLDVLSTRPGLSVAARTDRHVILSHLAPDKPVIMDVSDVMTTDAAWLQTAVSELSNVGSLERALAGALRDLIRRDSACREGFQSLARSRVALDTAVWSAVREHTVSLQRGARTAHYVALLSKVQDLCDTWAQDLVSLHPQFVSSDLLFHSLHRFAVPASTSVQGRCARCRTPLLCTEYTRWDDARQRRLATVCPACGPQVEKAASAVPWLPFAVEAGYAVLPAIAITDQSIGARRQVVMTVRDETTGKAILDSKFSGLAAEQYRQALLPPPTSPELHTISLLSVQGTNIAVFQQRYRGSAPSLVQESAC